MPAFKVSTLCGKKLDRNEAVCYRECGMVNKQSRCLQHGAEGSWDKGLLGEDVSEISGETSKTCGLLVISKLYCEVSTEK